MLDFTIKESSEEEFGIEQVFVERRLLNRAFRRVYDYNTGHGLKIIYSMDEDYQVLDIGKGATMAKMGGMADWELPTEEEKAEWHRVHQEQLADVQKNIRKNGNLDHRSTGGTVIAIVDRVTNERLQEADVFGPFSDGAREIRRRAGGTMTQLDPKVIKAVYDDKPWMKRLDVHTIRVGEKEEGYSTYKATHYFPDNPNQTALGIAGEGMLKGRGGKLRDLDSEETYYMFGKDLPVYKHPSVKDVKEYPQGYHPDKLQELKYMSDDDKFANREVRAENIKKLGINMQELINNQAYHVKRYSVLSNQAPADKAVMNAIKKKYKDWTNQVIQALDKGVGTIEPLSMDDIQVSNAEESQYALRALQKALNLLKNNMYKTYDYNQALSHIMDNLQRQLMELKSRRASSLRIINRHFKEPEAAPEPEKSKHHNPFKKSKEEPVKEEQQDDNWLKKNIKDGMYSEIPDIHDLIESYRCSLYSNRTPAKIINIPNFSSLNLNTLKGIDVATKWCSDFLNALQNTRSPLEKNIASIVTNINQQLSDYEQKLDGTYNIGTYKESTVEFIKELTETPEMSGVITELCSLNPDEIDVFIERLLPYKFVGNDEVEKRIAEFKFKHQWHPDPEANNDRIGFIVVNGQKLHCDIDISNPYMNSYIYNSDGVMFTKPITNIRNTCIHTSKAKSTVKLPLKPSDDISIEDIATVPVEIVELELVLGEEYFQVHDSKQREAIVQHELGHYKYNHIIPGGELDQNPDRSAFSAYVKPYSRDGGHTNVLEFEADRYAAKKTDPKTMSTALKNASYAANKTIHKNLKEILKREWVKQNKTPDSPVCKTAYQKFQKDTNYPEKMSYDYFLIAFEIFQDRNGIHYEPATDGLTGLPLGSVRNVNRALKLYINSGLLGNLGFRSPLYKYGMSMNRDQRFDLKARKRILNDPKAGEMMDQYLPNSTEFELTDEMYNAYTESVNAYYESMTPEELDECILREECLNDPQFIESFEAFHEQMQVFYELNRYEKEQLKKKVDAGKFDPTDLAYDFRLAIDTATRHRIKIIYSLRGMKISQNNVVEDKYGYGYRSPMSGDTDREAVKRLRKYGNTDHQSWNQKVLAIIDLEEKEPDPDRPGKMRDKRLDHVIAEGPFHYYKTDPVTGKRFKPTFEVYVGMREREDQKSFKSTFWPKGEKGRQHTAYKITPLEGHHLRSQVAHYAYDQGMPNERSIAFNLHRVKGKYLANKGLRNHHQRVVDTYGRYINALDNQIKFLEDKKSYLESRKDAHQSHHLPGKAGKKLPKVPNPRAMYHEVMSPAEIASLTKRIQKVKKIKPSFMLDEDQGDISDFMNFELPDFTTVKYTSIPAVSMAIESCKKLKELLQYDYDKSNMIMQDPSNAVSFKLRTPGGYRRHDAMTDEEYKDAEKYVKESEKLLRMLNRYRPSVVQEGVSFEEFADYVYTEAVFSEGKASLTPILQAIQTCKDELEKRIKVQDDSVKETNDWYRLPKGERNGVAPKVTRFDPVAYWKAPCWKNLEDKMCEVFGFRTVNVQPYKEKYNSRDKEFESKELNAFIYSNRTRYPVEALVTDKGLYDKSRSLVMDMVVTLGIIKELPAEQILAIILHEMGHGIDPALVDIKFLETNVLSKYITDRKGKINKDEQKAMKRNKLAEVGIIVLGYLAIVGMLFLPNIIQAIQKLIMGKEKWEEKQAQKRLNRIKEALSKDKRLFERQVYAEAFADNFARMYGYGAPLMAGLHKINKRFDDKIQSRYAKEMIRQEAITQMTIWSLGDEHKTDIHRIRSLLREYDNDLKDPNTPEYVKKQIREDKEELETVLDQYLNNFSAFQNRVNKLINEELEKLDKKAADKAAKEENSEEDKK